MARKVTKQGRIGVTAATAAAAAFGSLVGALFHTSVDVLFRPRIEKSLDATFKIFSGFTLDERILADLQPFEPDRIAILRRLLGVQNNSVVKLAGGRDHYLYRNKMHPDNQLALHALTKFLQTFRSEFELSEGGDFAPTGSFACLGGPISNARTALFLGYQPIQQEKPALGMQRRADCPLQLGIEFEVNSTQLLDRGLVVKGGLHNDPTPQWAIRLQNGQFLETEAGELDYLLISRIPNWIETPLHPKRTRPSIITIFAGCHGAGSNAVQLLLHHRDLLNKLDTLTRDHRYWQALIRVDRIGHRKHPITRSLRHMALSLDVNLAAFSPVYVRKGRNV